MPSIPRLSRLFKSWNSLLKYLIAPALVVFVVWRTYFIPDPFYVPVYPHENQDLPPIYPAMKDRERMLPQHNENLPFPEGKHGSLIMIYHSSHFFLT